MIDYKAEKNLVHCGNQDFIIKVDRLMNQKLRYSCWRRPKNILQPPDLILLNGHIRSFESLDKYEFIFPFGKLTYVIEQIVPHDGQKNSLIFLEVSDNNDQKTTWKLQDMKQSGRLLEPL